MSTNLILENNIPVPDDVYEVIIDMHKGLTANQSLTANAKLILILANHIADFDVIAQASEIARSNTIEHHEGV
ncbi:DUF2783 domain-containing protein [Temperatibacter marinus]|uniref:DUF2783 domain-containing protein n=1 Tax=Temperatibacter marinus TaxID=1456591 RepID=A0AA52HAG2_9PROT|nr:DUF2783 domain-containing protein [Temperatibacter marinus]WND03592.1 DUF2783 domain-containing protein [Temperatibacter marinus]